MPEDELREREAVAVLPVPTRGYSWLYQQHVTQPDRGCDFDFLTEHGAGSRAES